MITQDQWERMTPGEQAEAWWQELSQMIREAMEGLHYTSGNGQTLVVSGLTTIVGKKETPDSGS